MSYMNEPALFMKRLELISTEAAVMWDRDVAPFFPILSPFELSQICGIVFIRCMKPDGYVLWARWNLIGGTHWIVGYMSGYMDERFSGNNCAWPWQVLASPMPEWYCLYDANHKLVSDACVEGNAREFYELATAILGGYEAYSDARRCAVIRRNDHYEFYSPRNNNELEHRARLDPVRARELAMMILARLEADDADYDAYEGSFREAADNEGARIAAESRESCDE